MAIPASALTRRELLNVATLAFIPVGETVLATTLAYQTWPAQNVMVVADALVAGVTDYQMPDIETLELTREFEVEVIKLPQSTGGYYDDEDSTIKKVQYKGETSKTSSYFKRLELATATVPVIGTPITPFADQYGYIEGLAVIEQRNKNGTLVERIFFWSRLRLDGASKTDPKTRKIGFTLEKRDSSLNTVTILA